MSNGDFNINSQSVPSGAPPMNSVRTIVPAVIDLSSTTTMVALDAIILGRFSSSALAGCGIGFTLLVSLFTLFLTFVIGASVPISRHLGMGEKRDADSLFGKAMGSTALLGIFFGIVSFAFSGIIFRNIFGASGDVEKNATDYFSTLALFMPIIALNFTGTGILRATGDTAAAMSANLVANALNFSLEILFVFGNPQLGIPSMGPVGAALGLGISQLVGFAIQLRFIFGNQTQIKLHASDIFKPNLDISKRIFKAGIPATMEQLFWMFGQIVIIAYIARLGQSELAAHQIVLRMTQTLGVIYQALAFGNMALCGKKIGAGLDAAASVISKNIRYVAFLLGAIIGGIVFIFENEIIRLFTTDPSVAAIALSVFPILAVQQLLKSQTMITSSEIRARGDFIYQAILVAILVLINEIALSGIGVFVLKWGVPVVWALMVLDEGERLLIQLNRISKRIVKKV